MAAHQHSGSPGNQFPETIPWLTGAPGPVQSLDAPVASAGESAGRREDGKILGGSSSDSQRANPNDPSRLPAFLPTLVLSRLISPLAFGGLGQAEDGAAEGLAEAPGGVADGAAAGGGVRGRRGTRGVLGSAAHVARVEGRRSAGR